MAFPFKFNEITSCGCCRGDCCCCCCCRCCCCCCDCFCCLLPGAGVSRSVLKIIDLDAVCWLRRSCKTANCNCTQWSLLIFWLLLSLCCCCCCCCWCWCCCCRLCDNDTFSFCDSLVFVWQDRRLLYVEYNQWICNQLQSNNCRQRPSVLLTDTFLISFA